MDNEEEVSVRLWKHQEMIAHPNWVLKVPRSLRFLMEHNWMKGIDPNVDIYYDYVVNGKGSVLDL